MYTKFLESEKKASEFISEANWGPSQIFYRIKKSFKIFIKDGFIEPSFRIPGEILVPNFIPIEAKEGNILFSYGGEFYYGDIKTGKAVEAASGVYSRMHNEIPRAFPQNNLIQIKKNEAIPNSGSWKFEK